MFLLIYVTGSLKTVIL